MEAAGLQNLAKMWVRFPNGVQKYKSSIMVKHWGPRPRRYDVEFGSIPVSCANKELWCKHGVSRWTENPEVRVRVSMVPLTNKN